MRDHRLNSSPATHRISTGKIIYVVLLAAMPFIGCYLDDGYDPYATTWDSSEADEIVENLRVAGYPEEEIDVLRREAEIDENGEMDYDHFIRTMMSK